jgi:hypothetical protein
MVTEVRMPWRCASSCTPSQASDCVDEDLAAAAGNAVEAGRVHFADHVGHGQPEAFAEEHDLRRRETVDVDRMMSLDVPHQLQVPLERDVRIVAALQEDLHAADILALVDLPADLLEREHVTLGMLRPTEEGAEAAIGHADVRVVDVPVDDVRHHRVGMVPPPLRIRERAQFEQWRVLVELEVVPELGAAAIDGHERPVPRPR